MEECIRGLCCDHAAQFLGNRVTEIRAHYIMRDPFESVNVKSRQSFVTKGRKQSFKWIFTCGLSPSGLYVVSSNERLNSQLPRHNATRLLKCNFVPGRMAGPYKRSSPLSRIADATRSVRAESIFTNARPEIRPDCCSFLREAALETRKGKETLHTHIYRYRDMFPWTSDLKCDGNYILAAFERRIEAIAR